MPSLLSSSLIVIVLTLVVFMFVLTFVILFMVLVVLAVWLLGGSCCGWVLWLALVVNMQLM
jgi:hypothetical protein